MAQVAEEVIAGIKVLVALARADGTVHESERVAIETALEPLELPEGVSAATLLAGEVNVGSELAKIGSVAARKQTYESACAFVFVDGEASSAERALLDEIRAAFGLEEHDEADKRFRAALDRALGEKTSAPRADAALSEIRNAAVFSAVVATLTRSSLSQLLVFKNQIAMARNIGLYHGHSGDVAFWKTFTTNVLGAPGGASAVSSLVRMMPGWTKGASDGAFASTWALGKVTQLYFEKAEKLDPAELRAAFKAARVDGQKSIASASDEIAKQKAKFDAAKAPLDEALAAGKLTDAEYTDRLLQIHE